MGIGAVLAKAGHYWYYCWLRGGTGDQGLMRKAHRSLLGQINRNMIILGRAQVRSLIYKEEITKELTTVWTIKKGRGIRMSKADIYARALAGSGSKRMSLLKVHRLAFSSTLHNSRVIELE
jgi:hypothetical protein